MKTSRIGRVLIFSTLLCLCLASTAHATSYTLTVSAQGSGTVSKNPTNSTYPSGVTVIVTASPSGGWFFSNWSGDTNGSINPLNVTMNSDLVITGNFLPYPDYTLTLTTNGQGAIGLNPPGGSYQSNTLVTATATSANGWVFTGWSGATNTSANPVSLATDSNLTLSGNFAQLPAFDVQPVGVTNAVGSTIDFSSHAMGAAPLQYQWYFTGASLGYATNATLVLTNVSSGQAGNYWVIATNNYGSATSSVVALVLSSIVGPTNVVSSPDEASLRAAIALGGWVGINFNGTVTITNTISITNNVILDASGVSATISGGNAVQLFYVAPGIAFSVTNLILANGSYVVTNGAGGTPADGGAIYNDDGVVTLVACTLTNNHAQSLSDSNGLARGGAIFNIGGSVSLIGSSLSNNGVSGGVIPQYGYVPGGCGLGGAIFNTNGVFNVVNCTINSNSNMSAGTGTPWTLSSSYGGALFQASGFLTISNSLFAGNLALGHDSVIIGFGPDFAQSAYGGAIAVIGGSVVIEHSQFSGNTAQGGNFGYYYGGNGVVVGGAIYNDATLTASYSTFSKNQAICGTYQNGGANGSGGAIYNLGVATFDSCSIYSNVVEGGSAIEKNTYSYNGGPGLGGGIFNASQLSATNCTIALNTAMSGSGSAADAATAPGMNGNALGGGVFNNSSTTFNSSATFSALNLTIASNYCIAGGVGYSGSTGIAGGAEVANTNGTLALLNCIIAYGGIAGNAYGPITDDGFNISSDGSANLDSGSSYSFTDPQLGPLANYGGPTLCMALLPSSPAIDSADSSDFPPTDQRGYFRPFGSGPDIGAYEYGSLLPGPLYLSIAASSGNVQLSFLAMTSHVYLLQASINLATWTNLSTNGPFASETGIDQTISQQGFPVRYYRLVMQ